MKLFTKLLVFAIVVTVVAGCSPRAAEEKTANLVYVNWAEGIAYTNLAKAVLEDKMDFEVNLTSADVAPAYTAVATGSQDAFMETWLPILHADYMERYGDSVVDLGHVYQGTQSGLVVPEYVEIDKISEMNDYADRFNNQIVGIDSGAGVMTTTVEVIDMYDLELELIESSGPAMTAALSRAISNEEWVAVTGWRPHWKFGEWDLKFLEQDEDKIVWQVGNIHMLGRLNLDEDKPELALFLRNMFLTDEQLSDLMLKVQESNLTTIEVAREWMNDNEELIESWIP